MTLPIALNESNLKEALIKCKGDILMVSEMFCTRTPIVIDRMIRSSELLQAVYLAIRQMNHEYDKASAEVFEQEANRRVILYRGIGLDALAELATMPIDSKTAQVKLLAAARLAGSTAQETLGSDTESVLRGLNEEYQKAAPRIKAIRERVIEFESGATLVNPEPLPPGS